MVAAGLWLLVVAATPGQPDAGVGRGGFVWDIPEVVEDFPIGGTMVVDGLPMTLRRVRTRWKLEPLAKKLAADFLKAGLWIPPPSAQPQVLPMGYLTALDGRKLISYTVYFRSQRDGTTVLILAVASLDQRRSSSPVAPVFPGGTALITSDVEGMRAMSYQARATPAEVRSFYREVLGRGGYRELEPDRFTRGSGETLSVQVTAPPDAGTAQVLVLLGPLTVRDVPAGASR